MSKKISVFFYLPLFAFSENHVLCATHVVWKNFSILSPKLVLEYAEDILSDSRLKKLC